jgi:hypothetical protein
MPRTRQNIEADEIAEAREPSRRLYRIDSTMQQYRGDSKAEMCRELQDLSHMSPHDVLKALSIGSLPKVGRRAATLFQRVLAKTADRES